MKTRHMLIRLHTFTLKDTEIVVDAVRSFMHNKSGKDFSCFVDVVEIGSGIYHDVVAVCTDSEEKIAHAVAWGCAVGMIPFVTIAKTL